ncbi:hypothetical protein SAMN06265338_103295 [Rhodoblastus acidophilus]|uniref:Uncharacterized protein n=1 Tax=Rhodoblastus acidophilus TaxID=1074 RepID=A0A212RC52_RHOAC|nr:hypothetical protein [Rhodoblastus acidophilus]PPQ39444.1 hypothetical protein CKO16_06745 [Rhodoblastus acidophilus]RAI19466.1 hypothetical protein CH337_11935 [Rhodoblastus acidophilus]SNB69819.1 hypothetical protein SAMN06265338_103295 [Rhodoblastus acidophilus]
MNAQVILNAQVIAFPTAAAPAAARIFAFDAPPTAETLLERWRLADSLYKGALAEQAGRAVWANPPAGFDVLRRARDFFWERCVERVAARTVFEALQRSGADEARKTRVRDHFSAFCHTL